jgi:hypothetical protein
MAEVKHFDIDTGCEATLGLNTMPLHQYLGTTPRPDDVWTGPIGTATLNCKSCEIVDVSFTQLGYEGPEDAVNQAEYFRLQHCRRITQEAITPIVRADDL